MSRVEMAGDCDLMARGVDSNEQIQANAPQRNIRSIEIGEAQAVRLVRCAAVRAVLVPSGITDHIAAVAGGIDVGVAPAPPLQRVVAEASFKPIASGVALDRVCEGRAFDTFDAVESVTLCVTTA